MRLPVFKSKGQYNRRLISFGGINMLQNFSEGEMSDCSGISHLSFPAITQRRKNTKIFDCIMPTAYSYAEKECIATSDGLYYDRKKVLELSSGEKELAFLGSLAIVFPDKVYYDMKNGESGTLYAQCNTGGMEVSFSTNSIIVPKEYYEKKSVIESTVFKAGTKLVTYQSVSTDRNKVELSGFSLKSTGDINEGCIFYEKCEKNQYRTVIRKEINEQTNECVIVNELTTLENKADKFFKDFRIGDVVEISGCQLTTNNKTLRIISKNDTQLMFSSSSLFETKDTSEIVIKRKIPDFSCICSYENRLWGCEGNTIYASALGDPFNFFVYNNLSTDSFSVASNTLGDFTACAVYGNSCLFFKENACFKLYGDRPSNFKLSQNFGSGIKKSDKGSVVSVEGKVFYKGNGGIFVFYGGFPQSISQKLGEISMENAVAGSDGKCYYITADTQTGREEFVFDEEKGMWSKSGVLNTLGYSCFGGKLYRLMEDGVYTIEEEADSSAQWYAQLCPFDERYYKTKSYSRIHISAQLFENSYICVEVQIDGQPWKNIATVYGSEKKFVNIPCVLKSCHEVKVRISGKGKSIIESLTREFRIN